VVAAGALRALTTSAVALGGVAQKANADAPIDRATTSYNYSSYSEDDLDRSKGLIGGERSRYEIEMHQFRLEAPLGDQRDFAVEFVHETMSGASPWYVVPDAVGTPIQVMSGATIDDERNDIQISTNRYYDNGRLGIATGYSTENDYESMNFAWNGETHFNEKNTTLAGGMGFSFDSIEPTDADLYATRPDSETKQAFEFFTGLTQIMNRHSSIQTSLSYKHSNGYLDDPYKQTFVVGGTFLTDGRPDSRNQLALLARYRGHVQDLNASFHADYQFYIDDWDITSHTLEFSWVQNFKERVRVIPRLRYYSQTEADFYRPYYLTVPGGDEHSSDYRLSAYGALNIGLTAELDFRVPWVPWVKNRRWTGTASWERYISSADLSLSDVDVEAPGLVSFSIWTLGLGFVF
jgi:hypothetical protein